MAVFDYKKQFIELYQPSATPSAIEVPDMIFLQVDGRGNPNDEAGEYPSAVELIYSLSYAIKMLPKSGRTPAGYFDYVVPPLEGLWWLENDGDIDFRNKGKYCWTSMIRQPEFVTAGVFSEACERAFSKKPHLNLEKARLVSFAEGLCVQCMHIGPFDDEPATIGRMKAFMEESDLICELSDTRRHHEIYLSDPRKTAPDKVMTILRHPVRKE